MTLYTDQARHVDGRTAVVAAELDRQRAERASAKRYATPPSRAVQLRAILDQLPGEATATQEERMLAALHLGPLTTLEARRHLDILHPAGRVMALREAGHAIDTVWVKSATQCGREHRVGMYRMFVAQALA